MAGRKGKDVNKGVSHEIKPPTKKKTPAPKTPKTALKAKTKKPSELDKELTSEEMDAAMVTGAKTPKTEPKVSKAASAKAKTTKVFSFAGSPARLPNQTLSDSPRRTPEKPKKFFGSRTSPRRVRVSLTDNIVVETNTKGAKRISSESRKRVRSPMNLNVLKPTKISPPAVNPCPDPPLDLSPVPEVQVQKTPTPRKSPRSAAKSVNGSVAGSKKRKLGFDEDENSPPAGQLFAAPSSPGPSLLVTSGGPKVYPIFNKKTWRKSNAETVSLKTSTSPRITERAKRARLSKDEKLIQLQIDAGQRDLAAVTCETCLMVYVPGDEDDQLAHDAFHASAVKLLKLPRTKKEMVVYTSDVDDVRVVCIDKDSPSHVWAKLCQVIRVIDEELGIYSIETKKKPGLKAYLYVRKDLVEGAVIVESITQGNRAIPPKDETQPFCASEDFFPAVCGINRIWTSGHRRRKGIATVLVDSVRRNYVYGRVLEKMEVAFSDPTPSGISFATKYCGATDFLVYRPTP